MSLNILQLTAVWTAGIKLEDDEDDENEDDDLLHLFCQHLCNRLSENVEQRLRERFLVKAILHLNASKCSTAEQTETMRWVTWEHIILILN